LSTENIALAGLLVEQVHVDTTSFSVSGDYTQPPDGNSSDKVSRLSAVRAIVTQLREANGDASIYVADNGAGSRVKYEATNR
jgi:hypothetical protein